jgi:hypothetical protein
MNVSSEARTAAAERFWSPRYIQHNAHIIRDARACSVSSDAPATRKYEQGLVVAEGDDMIVHGRFSGHGLLRS